MLGAHRQHDLRRRPWRTKRVPACAGPSPPLHAVVDRRRGAWAFLGAQGNDEVVVVVGTVVVGTVVVDEVAPTPVVEVEVEP
jgi:hypothetical protein